MASNSTNTAGLPLNFTSDGGVIKCNGKRVSIKGVNWFGMETETYSLHGLWKASFGRMLKVLKDYRFNAVRIPISVELVEKIDSQVVSGVTEDPDPSDPKGLNNKEFVGLTAGKFLDKVLKEFAKAGMLVMFDMHCLQPVTDKKDPKTNKVPQRITPLWYQLDPPPKFDETRVRNAWVTLVNRFKDNWNFFACDLKNEPYGAATWGDGNPATDWCRAAEMLGNAVLQASSRMLIFVEGIEGVGTPDSRWGGNFTRMYSTRAPALPANRLVYSPHVYGPTVWWKEIFGESTFPKNMPDHWEHQWAWIKNSSKFGGSAICIGEWGGLCVNQKSDAADSKRGDKPAGSRRRDLDWHRALAEFLVANDIRDTFYWCFNPNSDDTLGLVKEADWVTIDNEKKLQVMGYVCPNPTSFYGGKVTFHALKQPALPWPAQLPGLKALPKDREPKAPAAKTTPRELLATVPEPSDVKTEL